MDPPHLTPSLAAVPGRSVDLTTEAWPAAFPPAADRASVEDSMGVEGSTAVVVSTAAEATGNWNSLQTTATAGMEGETCA
jgi:hypothetical protein